MKNSRKNEIKKAIMRKPKYGGPQGGRPNTTSINVKRTERNSGGGMNVVRSETSRNPRRVGRARAASNGIKYL